MRQFTTPEQTAKLVELGFEKPKSATTISWDMPEDDSPFINANSIEFDYHYSIGELIEMLPRTIKFYYDLNIFSTSQGWWVLYGMIADADMWAIEHELYRGKLIDALYDMVAKLKEEEVI